MSWSVFDNSQPNTLRSAFLLGALFLVNIVQAQKPDTLVVSVRAEGTGAVVDGATVELFDEDALLATASTSRAGEVRLAVPVATGAEYPDRFPTLMGTPYPSPFVGRTSVPLQLEGGKIMAQVFDLLGRKAAALEESLPRGSYEMKVDLGGLSAGHYLLVVQQNGNHLGTKSLVMVGSGSGAPRLDAQPTTQPAKATQFEKPTTLVGAGKVHSFPARGYWLRISRDGYITERFAILLPDHARFEVPLREGDGDGANSLGMEFVRIPAGTFRMGDLAGVGDPDERPVHEVTISRDFYMGRHEVTQAQWTAVMGSHNSQFGQCDDCPVDHVYWEDAQEFIAKLNEREGTQAYRLPTEAEWEYAARAGSETIWSFGDDESELSEYAWFGENPEQGTHPVGRKKPNQWGLYDVHGNVNERVLDWFDYEYYKISPAVDPLACTGVFRGYRGGLFAEGAWQVRSAHRANNDANAASFLGGIRVVKDVEGVGRNVSPRVPNHEVPGDGTNYVATSTTLAWSAIGRDCGALTYDIHLGTTTSPPLVSTDRPTPFYDVPLSEHTTYYWKVIAKDEDGNATEGPLWMFSTSSPKGGMDSYVNSLGMEFVRIPGGTFLMGDITGKGRDNERPVHEVTITSDYYIGRHEVTEAQWEAVMGSTHTLNADCGRCPVVNVKWTEVQAFIEKLNEMEGTEAYRLPTEAEWEYAARAGTQSTWSFGSDQSRLDAYASQSGSSSREVGTLKPNPWGIYDVHGNRSEWVQDWYGEDYYAVSPSVNPKGPDSGTHRLYRGGGVDYDHKDGRSARRYWEEPDIAGYYTRFIGFRLVKGVD